MKELDMRSLSRWLLAILLCGFPLVKLAAEDCPARPESGSVVNDPYSISSQNGVLSAKFVLAHSVDKAGYTHYCYKYNASGQVVEAPTLRVNPGDTLNLDVVNRIENDKDTMKMHMNMAGAGDKTCGDGGDATLDATNVHFHGLNVPPICHQDDVIDTLIQPGSPGFKYSMQIPATEPPGLYWYHPHVHGFTEFQVNGGAAGAIVVEGMEKYRPEVKGLTEHVFVIRQQYLVPWIPGPYELTINYQVAPYAGLRPIIQMQPGEKQFWRVANASIQDFLELQVLDNGRPKKLELIALDGYPLAQTRDEETILIPPAGRAEFIVTAPPAGGSAVFFTQAYSTGPTGNADIAGVLADIQVTDGSAASHLPKAPVPAPAAAMPATRIKFSDLADQKVTAERKLYFSEEFGGTNGPIEFYITVDGQKQKVFEANEKPVITTKVGAVEDWTIENRALETHAFHIHQIHFQMLEVNGKPAANNDLRDTIEIPYWTGKGPYPSVKVRMDFRDPTIAGTFLFHCHILLHEDLGMMHKILVEP
ncbi:MAG: multicopper oxidase domain-containing protein [Terriglobales bacterium]|jgi:FtsP/CotA-like multicopper oxidase with cupredoxin domain